MRVERRKVSTFPLVIMYVKEEEGAGTRPETEKEGGRRGSKVSKFVLGGLDHFLWKTAQPSDQRSVAASGCARSLAAYRHDPFRRGKC